MESIYFDTVSYSFPYLQKITIYENETRSRNDQNNNDVTLNFERLKLCERFNVTQTSK